MTNDKVDLTAKIEMLVAKRFRAGIQPLIDANKLGALLLQLSPSFRPKTNQLSELENIFSLFEDFPLAVELRNRDWLTGDQTEPTVSFFRKANVCLVSVDAPETEHFTAMPNVDFLTTPKLFYLRAHGRNPEAYIKGKTVQDRFDYDYANEEIESLSQRLSKFDNQAQKVFAVFNNNRHRYAPDAAARMQAKLAIEGLKVALPKVKQPALLQLSPFLRSQQF